MSQAPPTRRGLPAEAYTPMDGNAYRPWVAPEDLSVPEFTLRAVLLGAVLGVLFSAANAYLGLKVGMTVTASIPVSVLSMAILRGVLKKGSILENNMAQTVGSSGESLAAGVVFTIPALILMGESPKIRTVFFIASLGGLLGILMMIPLRRWLIVREHGKLPYPEGTGCAEVLVAGEVGGQRAKPVFLGLATGFLYKLGMDKHALALWSDAPEWSLHRLKTAIGMDALPSLLGVGFIIGPRIAALMLAGGALAWLALIPLIARVGAGLPEPLYPASIPISEMDHWGIWSSYVRYIGAGAVTAGGLISLARNVPVMVSSLSRWIGQLRAPRAARAEAAATPRTQLDLPTWVVIGGSLACAGALWALPSMPVNFLGALLVVVFTFFFTVVASRVVGLVGGSSLPVSGMTISALLGTSLIFAATGFEGVAAKVAALTVGAVVCVGISTAGDISQDLKTGFLLGATPRKQQLGEIVGVLTSAVFIGGFVFLLHEAFQIGSRELPAPQATLMKLVVDGVLDGNLPWTLVIAGAAIAVVVELLGAQSLPFAVGLYLPMSLSTPVMIGGLLRGWLDRRRSMTDEARETARQRGVLLASGLIAGEAVLGLFLAGFIVVVGRWGLGWSLALPHPWGASAEAWIGFLGLLALGAWFLKTALAPERGDA